MVKAVKVYIGFYNYRGVMTSKEQIAEFRNLNWAVEFIPTAQKWLTDCGGNSKILVEVFNKEYNAYRTLTESELKMRLQEDN